MKAACDGEGKERTVEGNNNDRDEKVISEKIQKEEKENNNKQ